MPKGGGGREEEAREGDKKEKRRDTISQREECSPRGAWPTRDVSAPCRRPRPRPRVVKSPGALVATGSVGPRSLGGCESLGLWPRPSQPQRRGRAIIAWRRGAYPEALCKAARAGPGAAALTLRIGPAGCPPPSSRGPSAAQRAGETPRAPAAARGHSACIVPTTNQDRIQTTGKGTCRQPRRSSSVQLPGSTDSVCPLTSTHML